MSLLRRFYLPLSRLWAFADAAHGSVERFIESTGYQLTPSLRRRLETVLFDFEVSRTRVDAVDASWREAFFNPQNQLTTNLAAIEKARKDAHQYHNGMRGKFRFLLKFKPATSFYKIPSPAEVADIYGDIRNNTEPYFQLPSSMPTVEQSHTFAAADGQHSWLRFRSPSSRTNDIVYARVHEPYGVKNPPTIIYGHGICVEFDYLHGLIDEVDTLCRMGYRVVRPEAPFHGRRRPEGFYGGEYISATSPLGVLDTFSAAVVERAVLMDWCRSTSTDPVTMGGSSLGALISQLVAGQSRHWPERLRPDALLLIMHCAKLVDALIHGSIAKLFGALNAKHEKGWRMDNVAEYFQALNAPDTPVVSPENIVSILGRLDEATPFAGGLELIDRWQVPEQNRFIWAQGHFSLPIAMTRNHAPLNRFNEIVRAL